MTFESGRAMEDVSGRRATRIAKWAVEALWWLGVLVAAGLLGWLVISPVAMVAYGVTPEVGVDVSVPEHLTAGDTTLTASASTLAGPPRLEWDAERGHLEAETASWWFHFVSIGLMLPLIAGVLWGVGMLRSFLSDVRAGDVFTDANARRLYRLAWLVVALGVAAPVVDYARGWAFLELAEVSGPVGPTASWSIGPFLLGALVLVLAASWRYGVELQREHDLTV